MTTLLPTLQSPNWRAPVPVVTQPLLNLESDHMPILSFVDDAPFHRMLRNEGDADALRAQSSANLAALPYQLDLIEDEIAPLIVLDGHEFASEQILCRATMTKLSEMLGCQRLVVGIPMRGSLVATSAEAGQAALDRFMRFVQRSHEQAPTAPISPLVFMVVDGDLVGAALPREPGAPRAPVLDSDHARDIARLPLALTMLFSFDDEGLAMYQRALPKMDPIFMQATKQNAQTLRAMMQELSEATENVFAFWDVVKMGISALAEELDAERMTAVREQLWAFTIQHAARHGTPAENGFVPLERHAQLLQMVKVFIESWARTSD